MRSIALVGVVVIVAGCGSGGHAVSSPSTTPEGLAPLQIHAGPLTFTVPAGRRAALDTGGAAAAGRLLQQMSIQQRAHAALRLRFAGSAAARLGRAASGGAIAVTLPATVIAIDLRLPTIRQRYRDDCEATALSMMLGGRISQNRLQALLPVAPPLEPRQTAGGMVWGDPERGFVGDVRGGGYGVYERPLLRLDQRFDPGARNLTRRSFSTIVTALQSGHPVLAWIQLGPSVPRSWTTPAGRTIHANFAEHAVTLTGWRPGLITYNNPWTGSHQTIPVDRFLALWHTLGDRAIEGSPLFRA